MMNDQQNQKICKIHNVELEFQNPNKQDLNQKLLCRYCVAQQYNLIHIGQVQEQNKIIINQFKLQSNSNIIIFKKFLDDLNAEMSKFEKAIKIFKTIVSTTDQYIKSSQDQLNNIEESFQLEENLKLKHDKYLECQREQENKLFQQLQILKQNLTFNQLFNVRNLDELTQQYKQQSQVYQQGQQLIQQYQYQNQQSLVQQYNQPLTQLYQQPHTQQQQQQIQYQQQQSLYYEQMKPQKQYEYKLDAELSTSQKEWCQAIAFSPDQSIVVAANKNKINLYEICNNRLKFVKSFDGHSYDVICLQFMKKSNQFISGGYNDKIKIWKKCAQKEWQIFQTLDSNYYLTCLILSSNDDQIISGSSENSIFFWRLLQYRWEYCQKIECSGSVQSISLNESSTKLISAGNDSKILVFEQKGNQWVPFQTLNVEEGGLRLSFINENEFIFLPQSRDQIYIYHQNLNNLQFNKSYQIQVNGTSGNDIQYFPIAVVQQPNLIIVKNSKYIYILAKQDNERFDLTQTIEFQSEKLFGSVSYNGLLLLTWEKECKGFEIRLLNLIQ